jgi:hypothetical protein
MPAARHSQRAAAPKANRSEHCKPSPEVRRVRELVSPPPSTKNSNPSLKPPPPAPPACPYTLTSQPHQLLCRGWQKPRFKEVVRGKLHEVTFRLVRLITSARGFCFCILAVLSQPSDTDIMGIEQWGQWERYPEAFIGNE